MTERLQKCLDAGGVLSLFPLLADWSQDELRALVEDATAMGVEAGKEIDSKWQKETFKPENFFNNHNFALLDAARENAHINALAIASEIISVALYYLPEEPETAEEGGTTQ